MEAFGGLRFRAQALLRQAAAALSRRPIGP